MSEIIVLGSGLLGSAFSKYDIPVITKSDCDITSRFDIEAILAKYTPRVVVNCAGIVPKAQDDLMTLFRVNSLAPRMLASALDDMDARLVQVSTDCVFSGLTGNYLEIFPPDPTDFYGLSKSLGEITEFPHLTIRTSFVGYPDPAGRGLLAWASQQKIITGYDKVLWNGLTVDELVKQIVEVVIPMKLSNIVHLHGETVSKYEMLKVFKHLWGFNYQLVKESEVTDTPHECDKTLTSMLPEIQTKKTFVEMMQEMKDAVC